MEAGTTTAQSPLEGFVRDYVDVTGGAWDEIEPQVYDLLLPTEGAVPEQLLLSASGTLKWSDRPGDGLRLKPELVQHPDDGSGVGHVFLTQ